LNNLNNNGLAILFTLMKNSKMQILMNK